MEHLAHFQALYEAFNHRDSDRVLAMMSDEVDWPNAWQGGRLVGREAVRHYWSAQWAEIDPRVEPPPSSAAPHCQAAPRVPSPTGWSLPAATEPVTRSRRQRAHLTPPLMLTVIERRHQPSRFALDASLLAACLSSQHHHVR